MLVFPRRNRLDYSFNLDDAATFDGLGSQYLLSPTGFFDSVVFTRYFIISYWVYHNYSPLSGADAFVFQDQTATGYECKIIESSGNLEARLDVDSGPSGQRIRNTSSALNTSGTWHHVYIRKDNLTNDEQIVINGVSQAVTSENYEGTVIRHTNIDQMTIARRGIGVAGAVTALDGQLAHLFISTKSGLTAADAYNGGLLARDLESYNPEVYLPMTYKSNALMGTNLGILDDFNVIGTLT